MADGARPPIPIARVGGRWTISYLPPAQPAGVFKFQHDDFDGTPDLLDPRQGLAATVEDCLRAIAALEAGEDDRV